MNFGEWFSGKKDAPTDDNASQVESNISPAGLRVADSESAKVINEIKQKKRIKDESGTRTFTVEESNAATIAIEQAKILDAILDPKVWRGAVAAPGDMMVAVTGKKHWELSDDERDTLAKTGAATARCFAVTDPKWLALSLFGFSVLSIYGGRLMKDLRDNQLARQSATMAVKNAA